MARASVVTLNRLEVEVATVVGTARQRRASEQGFRERSHVSTDKRLGLDVQGAAAELAASKYLRLVWNFGCEGAKEEADLYPNVEVRTTRHLGGRLIVRPQDIDDRPYVLVVGELPTFRVVGWAYGHEAKREEPRADGSHWLPQSGLRRL